MNTFVNHNELGQAFSNHYINQYIPQAANLQHLKRYLTSFGPVPINTTYIGTCNDGLPLFFDLGDASPGSLLIVGTEQEHCIPFLRNLLASTLSINARGNVYCSVISPNVGNFSDLAVNTGVNNLFSPFDSAAHEHIVELSILAEQRRSGRHYGPINLIIIDDLAEILKYNNFETTNHLGWLAANGPKNSIWLVASISYNILKRLDKKILGSFGTFIFNRLKPALSAGHKEDKAISIDTYSTQIGNDTLDFYLPLLV